MAGIKYYLCATEDGPQLVHLQSDAKRIDPNYEITEVDTSKAALMERLNDLMRRAHVPDDSIMEPYQPPEEGPAPTPLVANPLRSPAAQARCYRNYDQIDFEFFIWDLPADEEYRLDKFEMIIKERRAELAASKAKKVVDE